MYFAYTEEQEDFRVTLRKFFDDYLPHAALPKLLEREEIGTAQWSQMAQELGLQGLAIAEEREGSGFGMVELTVVLEEAGRALLPEPLFSTLLGAQVLGLADEGEDTAAEILSDVASGHRILAVALTDRAEDPVEALRTADGGWILSGAKIRVPAGQLSDTLIVSAQSSDGSGLFAVKSTSARIEPVDSLDIARPQATIVFNLAPARILSRGESITDQIGSIGSLMLAAEQVGGAGRCLDIATEHAKSRKQFGRVIGSFQAIKHQCADMLVRYETARTALMYAAWTFDDNAPDRQMAAAVAKASASDAYWDNARGCIQVLGGIGFTADHPAQLHFKRASVSAQLFGSAEAQREKITDLLITRKAATS
jgi:alkylation response protein AidB-like acyl-CoA dehydrogenase